MPPPLLLLSVPHGAFIVEPVVVIFKHSCILFSTDATSKLFVHYQLLMAVMLRITRNYFSVER